MHKGSSRREHSPEHPVAAPGNGGSIQLDYNLGDPGHGTGNLYDPVDRCGQRRRCFSRRAHGHARADERISKGHGVHMTPNSNSASTLTGRGFTGVAAATIALFQLPVGAEDIDLFVQPAPDPVDLPNVLIILDNTANWNTPFVNEKQALIETLNALPVDQLRVALMLSPATR